MTALDTAAVDRFLAADPDAPVVMLNLLRFEPVNGAATYRSYIEKFATSGVQERYGVEIVYGGMGDTPLATAGLPGDAENAEKWDMVALVRYPTRKHFADMIADPDYLEFEHLRAEAVTAAVLQPTTAVM